MSDIIVDPQALALKKKASGLGYYYKVEVSLCLLDSEDGQSITR